MSDIWPDNISSADAAALNELAAAGIGEGDFDGDEHGVPADLVELYEVLEWENAVADAAGEELPHPSVGVPPPNDPGVANSTPLVSRAGWGARPARSVTPRYLSMLTAHYGGPSPWGAGADRSTPERFAATTDHARCPTIMRAYQAFHMDSRGWVDFAYSSGDCPHGVRYEGRGLDVRTAAQGTTVGNDTSHASCYLAGDGDPLTAGAKESFADESRRFRGLTKGHRDWKPTACPGDPLYRWVHSNQQTPTPEDDLDMDDNHFKTLVRQVLNEGTGPGQTTWGGTSKATLATTQSNYNMLRRIAVKVDALDAVDEAEVARLVLDGFDPAAVAAAIPDDIAKQVADELGARLQS